MASNFSNKWLSSNCPQANQFSVNKSHTKYWIVYQQAFNKVNDLNDDMQNIKSNVSKLISDIEGLKGAIDSQDYIAKTKEIETVLEESVKAIESNMTKLFTSCVNRLDAQAQSDSWFGENASAFSESIRSSILQIR